MPTLRAVWMRLRSGLWFVPSLVVALTVGLAVLLIEADAALPRWAVASFPRLFGAGAEGTRGMLSAIASAMITVAGVVFSVTIVALSLTSSQYTPRVLRNFMRDGSNRVVLGAFVGIYAYCLVVLRTIRSGPDGEFVPAMAVFGAMVLAFVGIALLIHFIHHISSAIQAEQILASIAAETGQAIERLFPQELGTGDDDEDDAPRMAPQGPSRPIVAPRTGYLQAIDDRQLLSFACAHQAVVRLRCHIGAFVMAGETVAESFGRADSDNAAAASAFTWGHQRTMEQDAAFGIRQVVDIALKALSPAVSDPTTATLCMDHLSTMLARLARRRFPRARREVDGQLRVIATVQSFEALLGQAVDEIRLAAAGQATAIGALLQLLERVRQATDAPSRRRAVECQLERLGHSVSTVDDPHARQALAEQLDRMLNGAGAAR